MSELKNREEFSHYDSMTTKDLQDILRKHAHGELEKEPDTDELYYIMEVLAQRRQQQDPQAFRSNEEALADFRKHYMPKEDERDTRSKVIPFPNRLLKTVAAVLAMVLILGAGVTVTAEAFHIDIWGKFASWSKEIFQLTDEPQGSTVANPDKENNLELESLRDALSQYNIQQEVIPTWLPEGFVFVEINSARSPREISITAKYENDTSELIIRIRQTIGMPANQVEKNDDLLEEYVVNGVRYFIFSNTNTLQAAWSIGEFECIIGGDVTLEEMKMMIDSI